MLRFTGRIYTGLLEGATTEAVLVGDDGRIAAAGAEAKRADVREVVLGERVVVPGFIDAHVHLEGLAQQLTQLLLADATSLDDVLDRVRERAEASPGNEVIFGTAWDESDWPEPAIPTRETLDAVAPDRAVVLRRVCGHLWVVNSRALGLIAVRDDLTDAQRERLKVVAAAGVLREDDIALASSLVVPSTEQVREGLTGVIAFVLSMGATTLQDMGSLALGGKKGSAFLDALREMDAAGQLPVRVVASLHRSAAETDDLASVLDRVRGKRIHPGPVKVFLDGSIGAQTAAISQPFDDSPGNTGQLLWETDALERVVSRAHAAGLQIALHAIGDRAIGQALDVLEHVLQKRPRDDHRHRIEHVEIVTPRQIERMGQLGVIASMQPNFVGRWQGEDGLYAKRLGRRRDAMNPLRSMLDAGVTLAFGSDGMPFGPLYGIRSAMHHTTASESLSFVEALHAYTQAAAFAGRIDHVTGSVEPGKQADLVVLSADPAERDDVTVVAVFVDGKEAGAGAQNL
ncbi:MAG TPA: amidohydrolase [Planctomycetota bacterium]|nr:amidohydrolase [Planctomycetota bacterium]